MYFTKTVKSENGQILWLNCTKAVAIIAVLVQHMGGHLFDNESLIVATYFCVALFILVAGITSQISNEKHDVSGFAMFYMSIKEICIAYLIAGFVYQMYFDHFFNFETYIRHIVRFDISTHFYFVILYIQLMAVKRILYYVINFFNDKLGIMGEIILGVLLLVISVVTTNRTNILNIYGGGGRLLGGTYLVLYYIGMLFERHNLFKITTWKKSITITLFFASMWLMCWRFACVDDLAIESKIPFGAGFNPPGVTICFMAIITLWLSFGIFTGLQCLKLDGIVYIFSFLGKHTIYIFLYHIVFLKFYVGKFYFIESGFIKTIACFTFMVMGSLAMEMCVKACIKVITYKKNEQYKERIHTRD